MGPGAHQSVLQKGKNSLSLLGFESWIIQPAAWSQNRLRYDVTPLVSFITIYLLHYNPQHVSSSTMLIFRRRNCIITASGIVTLGRTVCRVRADCSPLSTGILYGRLQRVTIPEAVIIQFVLLKMNKVLLETCGGLQCNLYIVTE